MTQHPFSDDAARADAGIDARPAQYTGRYLVLLPETDAEAGLSALRSGAGVRATAHVLGEHPTDALAGLEDGAAVVFDRLGVAVVSAAPDRQPSLLSTARQSPAVLAVERERRVYAFGTPAPQPPDESQATWGLQASGVLDSAYCGRGVRVAVLDTGFAPVHRDFGDRVIKKASFVAGQTVDDGHGHGTHCIGTSCGPRHPATPPAYGIAGEAEIYAGKVLSDQGSGDDTGIIAGINWAVGEGCKVISMSLGAPTEPGDTYSRVYEALALRALGLGTLIVAAAGNESKRPGHIAPVGHPANCPSIVAVAALAPDLSVAWFSSGAVNPDGGEVNIAAAGVDILSAAPEPAGYARMSGTSMATPHVAGIVALFAEAFPGASATELRDLVLGGAQGLPLPSSDVGCGLVQAP
jgi:subtilisin family serine protease